MDFIEEKNLDHFMLEYIQNITKDENSVEGLDDEWLEENLPVNETTPVNGTLVDPCINCTQNYTQNNKTNETQIE